MIEKNLSIIVALAVIKGEKLFWPRLNSIESQNQKWSSGLSGIAIICGKTKQKNDTSRKEQHDLGDKEFNKKAVAALRAMADKLEQHGPHFIVDAQLPKLPIFAGDDDGEKYISHIEVTLVAGPLGG